MTISPTTSETISAISTATGAGGIGIVRLSGPEALPIADTIFRPRSGRLPSACRTYSVHYGQVIDPFVAQAAIDPPVIDEALLTVMRAPRSYTCEDVVEISCHGGLVPLRAVLQLTLTAGARLAEPGEFTKRAFLNGRIDLTQAEAVLDVIQSRTESFLRVANHQLKGQLSTELDLIRDQLLTVYTELEAAVNFPEDDIDQQRSLRIDEALAGAQARIERLLASADEGRLLREGLRIVLGGKPNVGKSSLLNVLLKQPRAIVSEVAGTTRDTIEEPAQIRGVPVQLVDTAGVLEPRDLIEEEAVRRSRDSLRSADIALMLLDVTAPLSREDEKLLQHMSGQKIVLVLNKCDRPPRLDDNDVARLVETYTGGQPPVRISALTQDGVAELEERLLAYMRGGSSQYAEGILVSNIRHIESLRRSLDLLCSAARSLASRLSPEFVSEDVRRAAAELDRITGRELDEDLIDRIFSGFCIGK